ncbi:MAG: DUF1294 domain-containing protein [Candidatus Paceibacteria bacterium]
MVTVELIAVLLLGINLISIMLMGYDKRQNTLNSDAPRLPEGVLFLMAIVFGSAGVLLGMFAFRHKIRKWYFQVAIPLLLVQQILLGYFVYPLL